MSQVKPMSQVRFWNTDLSQAYQAADRRGLILKSACSPRDVREQGCMYALYRNEYEYGMRASVGFDSIPELVQYLQPKK
jgi:uncharacterized circularly permuted ATP-grasp superfamily protein